MFLRHKLRRKDGKLHRYWSVRGEPPCQRRAHGAAARAVSGRNQRRATGGRCRTIEAFDERGRPSGQIALFPDDRAPPVLACDVVQVRLGGLRLHRSRQWGACWLACELWEQLRLDDFWSPRLPPSRQGARWLNVLKTQVAYRLIDPGSEWRLHRLWYERSAGSVRPASAALHRSRP